MATEKMIGIVGGMGPYAGLDLNRKIFDQTIAKRDQDHLRTVLISFSEDIADRTEYLTGKIHINPAKEAYRIIQKMGMLGVEIAGIPCNTFHAPDIFNPLTEIMEKEKCKIRILHMIREVERHIRKYFPKIRSIGVICSEGTLRSRVYNRVFETQGFEIIYPEKSFQEDVHAAIYDDEYGIKATSYPVTERSRMLLNSTINHLSAKGSAGIILGCTETPLAIGEKEMRGIPLIDSTLVLARALIEDVAPEKLKPFSAEKI